MDQYTVQYVKFQKVITHRLCNSMFVPESSSEVFVKNLPTVVREEDVLKFFQTVGDVYKIRIMMDNNLLYTRGFCYVTYVDPSMAKRAVRELNNVQFELNHYLLIESSLNNCRIFMGGIPTNKTKDAVWQELINHGVPNIIDVIMYRSYTERAQNRGFVFVEFQTHEQAAYFRAKYSNVLKLWNRSVIIDWSVPMSEVDETVLNEVKIIYMKNLDVSITPEQFRNMIHTFVHEDHVEKIYKFKNYAFVHLRSRHLAENLMKRLQDYYKGTSIEIEWAKPRSQYTTPEYRQLKVKSLSQSRSRNSSSSSTISLPDELWRTPSPRVYTPSPSPESSCFTFTRPQEAPERPNFNIPKATTREFYNPQPSERVAGPCNSPQNVQSAGPWKLPQKVQSAGPWKSPQNVQSVGPWTSPQDVQSAGSSTSRGRSLTAGLSLPEFSNRREREMDENNCLGSSNANFSMEDPLREFRRLIEDTFGSIAGRSSNM